MEKVTETFKALSDPNRVRILKMLQIRPLCVCEITELLGLATSTVSKHLSILRNAGFITDEKDGRWVNYSLEESGRNPYAQRLLSQIKEWLLENETVQSDIDALQTIDRYLLCNIDE